MPHIKQSSPANLALPDARGGGRGSKGHAPGAQKVAGATFLALLAGESFTALRAVEVGCLFGFVRQIMASGSNSIPLERARTYCAHFAQLDPAGFSSVVSTLSSVGVVEVGGDMGAQYLAVPALSAALEAQDVEQARRKGGWAKRRAAHDHTGDSLIPQDLDSSPVMSEDAFFEAVAETTSASEVADAVMGQAHAPHGALTDEVSFDAAPGVSEGADAMLFDAHELSSSSPSPSKKRATRTASTETERLLDAPGTNKEIVVTIPCQGGAQAHLTRDYLKSLAPLYPLINVQRQALLAAKWCHENEARRKTLKRVAHFLSQWLNRANERAETRTAVIAADRSRNGFGMGGAALAEIPAPAINEAANSCGLDKSEDLDDLADLAELDDSRVSEFPSAPMVAVAPQPFTLPRPRPVLRRFRPLTVEAGAQQ